ncbi:MAG: hypothetical protein Kow0069_21210 [Promethearchaeota archaeon]
MTQASDATQEYQPPIVKIYPLAHVKWCLHALQYPVEGQRSQGASHAHVLGLLVGNSDPGASVVNVEDYVPVLHSDLPVDFEEDPMVFNHVAEVNREELEVYETGNSVVGWFYSRGGGGFSFTPLMVKNHLYFQKEFLPGSIVVVFDPGALDEGYGFEIFSFVKPEALLSELDLPATLDWQFTEIRDAEEVFDLVRALCSKYSEGKPIVTEWSPEE